ALRIAGQIDRGRAARHRTSRTRVVGRIDWHDYGRAHLERERSGNQQIRSAVAVDVHRRRLVRVTERVAECICNRACRAARIDGPTEGAARVEMDDPVAARHSGHEVFEPVAVDVHPMDHAHVRARRGLAFAGGEAVQTAATLFIHGRYSTAGDLRLLDAPEVREIAAGDARTRILRDLADVEVRQAVAVEVADVIDVLVEHAERTLLVHLQAE